MNDELLQIPAHFDKVSTKKSGAWIFTFETIDFLDGETISKFTKLAHTDGNILFATRRLDMKDLANIPEPDETSKTDGKTPSQRLRAVLFVRWKQLGKTGDFDAYYRKSMEHFIDTVKEKLEPE